MGTVRRIYVEKKPDFAVAERELLQNIRGYLGISGVTGARVLIRYDIENISEKTYEGALVTIFSEPPTDFLYEESFPISENETAFAVSALPGQFDQRADSAEQCVRLLNENEEAAVRSADIYVIRGSLSEEELARIKSFCINPVDSKEDSFEKPETLLSDYPAPPDVIIFDGFRTMPEDEFRALYDSLSLAMTYKDFLFIRDHYSAVEDRDPSMTEIRVLDTYWSDHCRHTTFQTELKNIEFAEGDYKAAIEKTFMEYLADFKEVYAGRDDKFVCLMDIATMGARKLKRDGLLTDQEETDEINACSIIVPVDVNGQKEEWLINFKNETHNHPTEIEPFGGAATCLGGAIRDPLSGRTYVYQAMRVTGAADPTLPLDKTLSGKLPQRKLVTEAAHGYSSYGNQIGLATGHVSEIYHPDYVAKRMEIGAVIAAAPRKNVVRLTSDPGDIIILLGGRTGRDGCGGATGSSKAHNTESIETCGAEVQKGNPPTERKLQRLFRRPEASSLIRKCNDFGAGGVSVAIGELADGLMIDLDKVPKKYAGLDGTELAISESQERMAVVVAPEDAEEFMRYADEENLEATIVATVTESPRLVMTWRGKEIVNISRAFLDTNGAHQETDVKVISASNENSYLENKPVKYGVKTKWLETLKDLNVCSQKGLVEMFDSSIGASSVLMPFGGKYQLTPALAMAAKVPVLNGETDTVTYMSYGFDPYLSSWSPYHGAAYAVIDSVAKITAAGGDYSRIHFTFQEYFKRMTEDPAGWGDPFQALLGSYAAQKGLGLASIGGKDSMSGSFNEIHVPPTLVSFAVAVGDKNEVVTPELKEARNVIVRFRMKHDEFGMPDYENAKALYSVIHKLTGEHVIVSAYTLGKGGIAAALSKMAFGNKLGFKVYDKVDSADFFSDSLYGDIIAEISDNDLWQVEMLADSTGDFTDCFSIIGEVTDDGTFRYGSTEIDIEEALSAWTGTLESVYPTRSGVEPQEVSFPVYTKGSIAVCTHKIGAPKVFIPVFAGTNCEYDTAKAFVRAGARAETMVFRNLTSSAISESTDAFIKALSDSQILMFPGGFSAGDEPDGSGKFIAAAFRNERLKEAVMKLINERDGLVLGICNGFQVLIKLGLVPYGEIRPQAADSPTLTTNHIGRHISKVAYTKVVSNKSPWLALAENGGVYSIPISHGEGRFVAGEEQIRKLFETGCVATQYVDLNGDPTMDEDFNPNGSYAAIEGITSPDGRILGKMGHSERRGDGVSLNIVGEKDQKIFESGVKYFS
ncbi:MAG: phosphoribosylformylglycinamidine synthase [Lachnospiraceae bacterium]|nr:phosphoribosylformylglycinamidine synthase [Lachnospiraceae bacterium]